MAVSFEGSAKHCPHTTSKFVDQGCLTVLARIHVGWLFFLEEPGINRYWNIATHTGDIEHPPSGAVIV